MTVNILVPMAGLGSRFLKEGFTIPKQLINVGNKHLIDISLGCLDLSYINYNLIFIIRDDQIYNFKMDEVLKEKYGKDTKIVVLDRLTGGSVESCLAAKEFIDNDNPLLIHTLDIEFAQRFDIKRLESLESDGLILTFKSNSPNYSYVKKQSFGSYIEKTAEKKVIGPDACVGIYCFKRGKDFCKYADKMIKEDVRTNGEFYISPLYNLLIQDGLKIISEPVDKMHVFGTPEEFRFYKNNVCKKIGDKPIALCSDHSGYSTKELFKYILKKNHNIEFIDFGTIVNNDCNYSDYIKQATAAITSGECDFGFGFCRSGQGVNMCANKFKGIRSALVYNEFAMEMAIRHNCANFFAIPESVKDLLDSFIKIAKSTSFDGGRHQLRVSELEEIGRTNDLFKY